MQLCAIETANWMLFS